MRLLKNIFLFSILAALTCGNTVINTAATKVVEVRVSGYWMPDDFFRVYHVGEYKVLESHYLFDSTRKTLNESGNLAKSETLEKSIRTRFMVFHKDSSFGYRFNPNFSNAMEGRIAVDSAFSLVRTKFDYRLDSLGYTKPDSSTWNADKTERRDIYITKATGDLPTVWRALSYSSKLINAGETFSKNLDSVNKMKLCRIEIKYDSAIGPNGKMVPYPTYLDHEIKIITPPYSVDVQVYIKLYRMLADKN